jgi:copper chaperone CopZ
VTGCRKIEGVTSVTIDPLDQRLTLRYDPKVTTRERVVAAVQVVVDSVE